MIARGNLEERPYICVKASPIRIGPATGLILLALLITGCSAREVVDRDVITVEGVVAARGHEPFVRYVLETPERNFYALRIPKEDEAEFQTPTRLTVTGRVYVDDWDGRAFTHIDVSEWARIDEPVSP